MPERRRKHGGRKASASTPGRGRRGVWTGSISFGMVTVPVSLHPGARQAGVSFRTLAADGTPLRRIYYCPDDGEELSSDELVRGYPVDDHHVIVTDEELAALAPEKSTTIDLQRFVPENQIEPMHFDRPYFLVPEEGAAKPYRLLADAMAAEGRAGIATFVMRGHEYLVAILARDGVLTAETMRFADELRTPADVGLESANAAKKDVSRLRKAIAALARDEFDRNEIADDAEHRLRARVEKKRTRGEDVVHAPDEAAEPEGKIHDLMAAIRASMAEASGQSSAQPPLPDYDRLAVSEVKAELESLQPDELERLLAYERSHKDRKTVRQAVERRLQHERRAG